MLSARQAKQGITPNMLVKKQNILKVVAVEINCYLIVYFSQSIFFRETAFDLVDFLNCHRLKSIEELLCVFSCNRLLNFIFITILLNES